MCLQIDVEGTKKIREDMKRKDWWKFWRRDKVRYWKVMRLEWGGLHSYYQSDTWLPGIMDSGIRVKTWRDSLKSKLQIERCGEIREVHEGIHVFTTREVAEKFNMFRVGLNDRHGIIVEVWCEGRDLIAASCQGSIRANSNEAVFTKVELKEEDYLVASENIRRAQDTVDEVKALVDAL